MRRALGVALVAAAALAADAAGSERILVPSVRTPLSPGPPLLGQGVTGETRIPGHLTSTEEVRVGIDATGAPVAVSVLQRLELHRSGDYTFGVTGPISDVFPAAGTQSQPGLRRDLVVWAGFSAGGKLLAARVVLRAHDAAPFLPLRIRRSGNVVRITNATGVEAAIPVGPADARGVANVLAATRRALARGEQVADVYVSVPRTPRGVQTTIVAPLAVTLEAGPKHVTRTLGDGGATSFAVRVPPRRRIRVVARPVAPLHLLRQRVTRADGLRTVSIARVTVARELQYGQFLVNPDPAGTSSATYVFEPATARPATHVAVTPPTRHHHAWTTPLVIALCVLGAGGLVVLWAHS